MSTGHSECLCPSVRALHILTSESRNSKWGLNSGFQIYVRPPPLHLASCLGWHFLDKTGTEDDRLPRERVQPLH